MIFPALPIPLFPDCVGVSHIHCGQYYDTWKTFNHMPWQENQWLISIVSAAQPYPCLYWHNIVGCCYYKANILQIPDNKQHSMLVVAKSLVRLTSGPAFCLLLGSKLRLCSANHRAGCFSNLVCDWLSIVWAYSDQETENRPWSMHYMLTTMVVCQISCHMWLGDMNVLCTDISEMKNFLFWYMSQYWLLAWNTYRYKNNIKSRCYKYPCVMKAEAGPMQSGWPNLICP